MIDAQAQLVGLIGWPVEHSVSPAMHNAAFDTLGLDWRYLPLPVRPDQAQAAVRCLATLGFHGINVTTPHKQTVMPALDSIAPNSKELGAVNTLVIGRKPDGTPSIGGYNTDDKGFIAALRDGGFEPQKSRRAVVVGAGGAARAVVYGLLRSGIGDVMVLNRTLERAQTLISDLGERCGWSSRLHALSLTAETLLKSARATDLVVNTTTVGMWPDVDGSIWPDRMPVPPHLVVFDLVYNPHETHLLRQTRESGARAIGGLEMLVHQGALAFEMWTGRWPPLDIMRAAAKTRLSELADR
jgi:shikimate dehydrogenase